MSGLNRRRLLGSAAALLAAPAIVRAAEVKELNFFYPVTVSAPMATIIDGYCKQYAEETGIVVRAAYAGTYPDALSKSLTAIRGGTGPQFSILLTSDIHTLRALDLIVSLQEIGLD